MCISRMSWGRQSAAKLLTKDEARRIASYAAVRRGECNDSNQGCSVANAKRGSLVGDPRISKGTPG